jgi:hypothetical protein
MNFHVPANQSVCWSVYWQGVVGDAALAGLGYSSEECHAHKAAAIVSFDRGEPVWMAALAVKAALDDHGTPDRPVYRLPQVEKTPLQLARRVVRM